jgi:hypothetical protein
MLQTRALETWKHADATKYRDRIDYAGVFVPTDIAWEDQLDNLGFRHLEDPEREKLCIAAFRLARLPCRGRWVHQSAAALSPRNWF